MWLAVVVRDECGWQCCWGCGWDDERRLGCGSLEVRELELHSRTRSWENLGLKLLMTSLSGLAGTLPACWWDGEVAGCHQAPPVNHEKTDDSQQDARFFSSDVSSIHPASTPCNKRGHFTMTRSPHSPRLPPLDATQRVGWHPMPSRCLPASCRLKLFYC